MNIYIYIYTFRISACIAYFRKCTSKIFPSFFFIHRFRIATLCIDFNLYSTIHGARCSLLCKNNNFIISLDSWQIFSLAREKVEGTTATATTTTRTMAMNLLLFPFPELWVKFLPEKQIQLLRVGFVPLTKAKVTSTRSQRLFP